MNILLVGGVGKRSWKRFPEISATRLSFNGSLRPKIGLFLLFLVFISLTFFIAFSLFNYYYYRLINIQAQKPDTMELTNPKSVKIVSESLNAFSASLQSVLSQERQDANMVLSGVSLGSVLAMVSAGAVGATKNEIRSISSLPIDDKQLSEAFTDISKVTKGNENFTLDMANSLYVEETFKIKDEFKAEAEAVYAAKSENLDFSKNAEKSRKVINSFVSEKTKEKIPELFGKDSIGPDVKLVLVNAIYFKGNWVKQFDKGLTDKADFTLGSGKKIKVDMMKSAKEKFVVEKVTGLKARVLEMPYKGDRVVMHIVLPDEGVRVEEVEAGLKDFKGVESDQKAKVELSLPKFKIESTHNLVETLNSMGMKTMFDASKADFSGISGKPELFVSAVVQKAVIEVNEEGSEAAAATGMAMMMRSMAIVPPAVFNVDRPFIFMIRDKLTGLILFSGKVVNPNE